MGWYAGGLGLLTWLPSLPSPFPIHFPLLIHPLPFHSSALIPPGGPCIHWVQCWWVVVVDMKEIEVAVQGHSCTISTQTYGVFNSISVCLPHSTSHKFIKFLEIFLYTHNRYTNAVTILLRVVTIIYLRCGDGTLRIAKTSS